MNSVLNIGLEREIKEDRRVAKTNAFDSGFIGRNVHSGGTVNTDHRKNLLEFVLGEAAVTARTEVENSISESKKATTKVQNFEA